MKNIGELFIQATKEKFRFFHKGLIQIEDLWDLSLTDLDNMYRTYNKELKEMSEDSLLDEKEDFYSLLEKRIDIIKYVVRDKQERIRAEEQRLSDIVKKQKIMEELDKRKEESIKSLSTDELQEELEKLG